MVEVAGIGYVVTTPQALTSGDNVELFVTSVTRDTGTRLFGFNSVVDQQLFDALCAVHAVGPGVALGVMTLGADEVVRCIRDEDVAGLSKAPGVGKKTASSIAASAKLDKLDVSELGVEAVTSDQADAIEVLGSLGFDDTQARAAVTTAVTGGACGVDILRCALVELR